MQRASLADRVAAASAGRDRVLDAIRVGALVVVMVAHSLAWHISDGTIGNVLEQRPGLAVVTWGFQILALFFAAGAVSNARSLARQPDAGVWLGHRLQRLLGPVLVYATFWSLVLLPIAAVTEADVAMVGRFLAQLLWFAGVYLVVVAFAPWTYRHQGLGVLLGWLAAIAAIDVLRLTVAPAIGWLNMLLVWGWLHQVGYQLPRLRRSAPGPLLAGAVVAVALAVAVAVLGPYSTSMVTYQGDEAASNLAPPSIVVALHGLALILVVAAGWRWLDRLLARPAWWTPIALLASRGIGLYLWHIPVVGIAAGASLLLGIEVRPLSAAWWLLHVAVAAAVVAGAWLLAGLAQRPLPRLARIPGRRSVAWAGPQTALAGLLVLLLSTTGFATWWATVFLGVPGSTPILVAAMWLLWRGRPGVRTESPRAARPPAPAERPARPGHREASG
jgi:peptidoglycan/LPS O-acetylase OafA/YrhL